MQFIFFVPPNEELEGTLHPQKCGCTPKNEGKRVHVPPDEKTCGHTDYIVLGFTQTRIKLTIYHLECNDIPNDDSSQYFIDHTVHGTPYDIDDTIRLGAPYDIDATVRLGAPYDISDIVSTDYFFSIKTC